MRAIRKDCCAFFLVQKKIILCKTLRPKTDGIFDDKLKSGKRSPFWAGSNLRRQAKFELGFSVSNLWYAVFFKIKQ